MKILMVLEPDYSEVMLASELAAFLAKLPENTKVVLPGGITPHEVTYDSGLGTVEIT
jgi:hypothetical protein